MQSAVVLLSFAFFPRGQRGRDGQSPNHNLEKFSSFDSLIFVPVFEWFQIVLGKHRKHEVTTVFTYSHLNTPLGQSERAYYLSYFIKHECSQGYGGASEIGMLFANLSRDCKELV